jgi:hypothetical protein
VPMSMLKVTAVIGKQETGVAFEGRIVAAVNQLVRNYIATENHSCTTQLRHDRLNRVFELAGVSYQARSEPLARATRKRQAATIVATPPPLKKMSGGKR